MSYGENANRLVVLKDAGLPNRRVSLVIDSAEGQTPPATTPEQPRAPQPGQQPTNPPDQSSQGQG